jgi:hypothetical protein
MSQQFPQQPPYEPGRGQDPQSGYPAGGGQPYSQPSPYVAAGQGQLVVNLRKPFGLLSASIMSPNVKIDGYPAPARWEQNVYPIAAGRHQVQGSTNYMWEYGRAEMIVDIAPGQSVEVHYSSPVLTFIQGRMGFELQPRPGMPVLWALLAIPVVIIVIVVIAIVASAAGS